MKTPVNTKKIRGHCKSRLGRQLILKKKHRTKKYKGRGSKVGEQFVPEEKTRAFDSTVN